MTDKIPSFNKIESTTVGHYDDNAASFFSSTIDHDVTQNYQAFLAPFPAKQNLDILDLGCGPGRDLKYFHSLGHRPVGLDGSPSLCEMARQYSGCKVLQQRFTHLSLPDSSFDGVFANASLFHVPKVALPGVLKKLHSIIRAGGILFSSNPRGNEEGWSGQRYGHYMEFEDSKNYLTTAGFSVLSHYYRPAGVPLEQQPWLAMVSQRI